MRNETTAKTTKSTAKAYTNHIYQDTSEQN